MGSQYAIWQDPKFWVAVSFVLFVVLVGKVAWVKITEALDERARRVRAELDEAARLRVEAEAMLRQATAERESAAAEAEAMLARARAEAEALARTGAAEAEASAARRERMAMDRIAAAEAGALTAVRHAAAEVAIAAAHQVLEQQLDQQADAALIDAATADLPRALRAA